MDDLVSHEEYKKSGATIRLGSTNMPLGSREMNEQDLEGHRFRMGSGSTGPADVAEVQRFAQLQQFGD